MLCIALLLETIRSLRQERDENVEHLRVPRRCRCNPGNGFPVLRCHHQRRQWRFGRERRTRARAAQTVAGILAVHNEARRAVGVAPLAWSAASPGTPRGTRRRGAATARRGARRCSTSARTRSSGRGGGGTRRRWRRRGWTRAGGGTTTAATRATARRRPRRPGRRRRARGTRRWCGGTRRRSGAAALCATPATRCSSATTSRRGTTAPADRTDRVIHIVPCPGE